MTILVCGYIGSGKSTVIEQIVSKLNNSELIKNTKTKVFVFNCDEIAKSLYTEKKFKKLLMRDSYFKTKDIFDGDYVSQDKIKEYFFNSDFRHRFEQIVHDIVFEYIKYGIKANGLNSINIIETALPSYKICFDVDLSVWVWRDYDLRYGILRTTRNYSLDKFERINSIQEPYEKRYRKCDIILENNGSKEDFKKCLDMIKI